jgi:hypothetical protein
VGDGDAMGVARQIGKNGHGSAERSLGIDDPFGLAQRREKRRDRVARREIGVASNELAWKAASSFSRKRRPNSRERTHTCRKKPGRQATQRRPSNERPPPGAIIYRSAVLCRVITTEPLV